MEPSLRKIGRRTAEVTKLKFEPTTGRLISRFLPELNPGLHALQQNPRPDGTFVKKTLASEASSDVLEIAETVTYSLAQPHL
jgi:hypothetical protein